MCTKNILPSHNNGSLESKKIIIGSLESKKIIIGSLELKKIIIGSLESEKLGLYRSIPGT